MFVNSGTRGNKIGLLRSLSVSPLPLHKTRDTPSRVKQGGSKKSFGINSWHLSRKGGKNCNKRKIGERIFGLLSSGEGRAFFQQKVLQKCTDAKRQRKRGLERLLKSWMPNTFVEGSCFGTPLYTTC